MLLVLFREILNSNSFMVANKHLLPLQMSGQNSLIQVLSLNYADLID